MYYLFIMRQVICLFVYIGKKLFTLEKIPGLRRFLDSNLPKTNLGLLFPLGTFPKNFVQIRPRFI